MGDETDIVWSLKEELDLIDPRLNLWLVHSIADEGADVDEHQHDYWKLKNHFAQSV